MSGRRPTWRWWPAALLSAVWVVALGVIASHRVFVTNDSLSNYAHVWNVAHALRHDHWLPFHFPALASGRALAYPYAFLPWTGAALFRPLLGDRATTLCLVAGFLFVMGAIWAALPEVRRPWAMAAILANPVLVEAVLLGQLPFLWAVAFFFAAVWAWRRAHLVAALLLAVAAMSTHPAVMGPIFAGALLIRLRWEPRRRRLLIAASLACAASLPAAAMAVFSPVTADSSVGVLIANLVGTVAWRAIVVAVPFIVAGWRRSGYERAAALLAAALLLLNPAIAPLRHNGFAWGALGREPNTALLPYLESPGFHAGATYRLLRVADGKVGMYQLIRHGGILDSEFFPESLQRRSWDGEPEYLAFLADRKVDYVLIYDNYDRRYATNEHALLRALAGQGCAEVDHADAGFEVFRIEQQCLGEVQR